MDDIVFDSKIKDIQHGRNLWLEIKSDNEIKENDLVIIYPDEKLVKCAEKYIEIYVLKRNIGNVYAISNLTEPFCTSLYKKIIQITDEEMEYLTSYYSMLPFHNQLAFISLNRPQGRIEINSMINHGISIDDIIKYGVFGFSEEEIPYD